MGVRQHVDTNRGRNAGPCAGIADRAQLFRPFSLRFDLKERQWLSEIENGVRGHLKMFVH